MLKGGGEGGRKFLSLLVSIQTVLNRSNRFQRLFCPVLAFAQTVEGSFEELFLNGFFFNTVLCL